MSSGNSQQDQELRATQEVRKRLISKLISRQRAHAQAMAEAAAGEPPNAKPVATIEVLPAVVQNHAGVQIEDEVEIPDDKSEKTLLVALLDGMDRQNLAVLRLKVDEGSSNIQAATAGALAKIISEGLVKGVGKIEGAGEIPYLPDEIPAPVLVPGELDPTGSGENWKDFSERRAELPEPDLND